MQEYMFTNKLSAKGKVWQLKDFNESQALAIGQKYGVSDIVSRMLCVKNVELDNVDDFLSPKLKNLLPDPSSLIDMNKAVDRILNSIKNDENIIIYGDYDVDGATSSAILRRFFDHLKVKNKTYIPDRINEGYGLNTDALLKLKKEGADLVITVDCGVVSFEPIKAAKEASLEIIVIDHHISTSTMPEAVAIVNPNRFDEKTDLTNLCAAGVAFLLVIALNRKLKEEGFYNYKSEPDIVNYLDLVALGTVCDVMTLTGLNRAFVTQGLKIMANSKNAGINALIKLTELDRKPDVYTLGFIIGPRINAGGRIGNCKLGSDLLSTDCAETAMEIATILDGLNKERQEIEKETLEEALEQAEKQTKDKPFIMVKSKNWHPGVIGIVAGRIKEQFNKPTAVIAIDENQIGKASARSVGKVDIGRAITNAKTKGILLNGGGHKAAGGFTVEAGKLNELYKFFCSEVEKEYSEYSNDNSLKADLVLSPNSLNIDLLNDLENLAPYGMGNSEPRVILENIKLANMKIYSEKHIAFHINNNDVSGGRGQAIKAICFNAIGTDLGNGLLAANMKTSSILGKCKKNEWQGRQSVEFIIEDVIIA